MEKLPQTTITTKELLPQALQTATEPTASEPKTYDFSLDIKAAHPYNGRWTGRHPKFSNEKATVFLNGIKRLIPQYQLLETINISPCTLIEWVKRYPTFAKEMQKARDEALQNGKEYALKHVFKHMDRSWQAAAWYLERKFQDEYALKQGSGTSKIAVLLNFRSKDEVKEVRAEVVDKSPQLLGKD